MSYNKQVWATGIPERTKLMKMDEGISSIDQSKLDKPTNTGTTGQVLKKTATGTEWANGSGLPEYTSEDFRKPLKAATSGPMWGTIDGEYVSYDSSQNYGVNTVGRAIKEQSVQKVNKLDLSEHWDSTNNCTDEIDTGDKWIDGKTIYLKIFKHSGLPQEFNAVQIPLSQGASISTIIDASGFLDNGWAIGHHYVSESQSIAIFHYEGEINELHVIAGANHRNIGATFIVYFTLS